MQVLGTDRMVNAVDTTLDVAPEPFHVVGMDVSEHVLLGAVLDDFVVVAQAGQAGVARHVVGVDDGVWAGVLGNHGEKCPGFYIRHDLGDGLPASLYHTGHDGLTCGSTSTLARSISTDVRFINFNLVEQERVVLSHESSNLFEHPPRCLVGDADLSFQLLGGYARASGGHEEHGVEPRPERSSRLVEDGIGGWGDVIPAELAAVDLATGDAEVLGDALALGAGYTVRPSSVLDELKAGIVVGKLGVELFDCVSLHGLILSQRVRDVKG